MGLCDDVSGEAVPACFAAGGEVVEAEGEIFCAIAKVTSGNVGGDVGEQGGSGGCSELIGDDAKFFPSGSEAKDGFEKIFPVRAEDPTGAENEVRICAGGKGDFACELGFSIDAGGFVASSSQ